MNVVKIYEYKLPEFRFINNMRRAQYSKKIVLIIEPNQLLKRREAMTSAKKRFRF